MVATTLPLLALLVPTLLGESPGCQFLCGDGFTCLASHQVCDNYYDCPSHPAGEGGEDEEVCNNGDNEEEGKEENTLEAGGALGLRADISTLCLDSQAQLVADPNDCHTFYHCDELSPQKQSCGDLMFNTIRMTCDWPRSVMQIRPECRDPDSFKFRLGPRSWDSRRTHRMLNWLGDGRAIARVRVPRPQLRQQQYPRYQQPAPVFRPNSVQVVDQQRRRLMDERPRVVMPSRLSVPETPLVYASETPLVGSHVVVPEPPVRSQVYNAPEAPRPHVVRLDLDNDIEEHHYQAEVEPVTVQQAPLVHHRNQAPVVQQAQVPRLIHRAPIINRGPPAIQHSAPAVVQHHISPEAPRPHVVRLEQRRRVKPVVRLEQAPLVRVEQAPVVRVEHHVEQAPVVRVEQAPVRVHSTPSRFQPSSSLEVKQPSAEDLTFLISQQITQSIRNRIPTILSNLQAKQSKQTKAIQPPVSRVTHTVTSTSSQVSSSAAKEAGPSHHYVQNSIVGQPQRMKKKENEGNMEKMEMENMEMEEMERQNMMEDEDVILPQPAPMLVEDTREHKPVWTVTRQRPKQKTTAKPRKTKIQQGGGQVQPEAKVVKKVCWIGGGRSALTCKQVRRKLVGEDGKKPQQQTGRRRIQSMRQTGSKPAEKKQKSRMLLHEDPQTENELEEEFSFELANRVVEENKEMGEEEERRAITLKEAFDRTINKLGKEVEEEEDEDLENIDADRLRSMSEEYSDTLTKLLDQLEDTERQYIDSSDLRQGDY